MLDVNKNDLISKKGRECLQLLLHVTAVNTRGSCCIAHRSESSDAALSAHGGRAGAFDMACASGTRSQLVGLEGTATLLGSSFARLDESDRTEVFEHAQQFTFERQLRNRQCTLVRMHDGGLWRQ